MGFSSQTGFFFKQILVVVLFLLTAGGCTTSSPDERWEPVVRHDDNQVHVVQWPDETLSAIASWYTGSSDNVDALANANPTLDSTRMQKGDQVFIPQNLLKTRAAMSRDFLNTFLSSSVVTVKTGSVPAPKKTVRILTPIPYKKKKDVEPVQKSEVDPVPEQEKPVREKDVDWYLFGPR
jgi:hypothetical protein